MRVGTPGFNGRRLRNARQARGLSATDLANIIGVSNATVSRYEDEDKQQSPSPAILERICATLNLPSHHFLRPIVRQDTGIVFYRSLSSATKSARHRAEQRYRWLQEIVDYLRNYVRFPPVNLPDFKPPADPTWIRKKEIEEWAHGLRTHWGLDDRPIANVVTLLEKHGVIVVRHQTDSEDLDAFSEWDTATSRPFVVLSSNKEAAVRSRFDACHELGHLLLHRNVALSTFERRANHSLMEKQADRFSGALLLPEESFSQDLYAVTLDALRSHKPKWRVSIGAMLKRCVDLGLVSEKEERRLWINYARRGWRKREPMDDELLPENPCFLTRSINLILANRIASYEDVPFQVGLRMTDVEELLGLPARYFAEKAQELEEMPDIIRFKRTESGSPISDQ